MINIEICFLTKNIKVPEGTKRRIPIAVYNAKTKKDREFALIVTNGIGNIDDTGLYRAPMLTQEEKDIGRGITANILAISKHDKNIKDETTIEVVPAEDIGIAPNHTKKITIGFLFAGIVGIMLILSSLFIPTTIIPAKYLPNPLYGWIILFLVFCGFGASFLEILDPDVGFVYKRGELIGKYKPDWYLIIPFVWSIDKKTTAVIKMEIDETMYTMNKTEISIKGLCFFQLVNPMLALRISDDDIKEKVKGLMMSEIKTHIGSSQFSELLAHKASLENTIQEEIDSKIEHNGYLTTAFEITDLTENIESKAAQTKVQGKADAFVIAQTGSAEAKVMGEKAKEVSDNIGEKWQGVFGLFAQELGKSISRKMAREPQGKTPKKGNDQ